MRPLPLRPQPPVVASKYCAIVFVVHVNVIFVVAVVYALSIRSYDATGRLIYLTSGTGRSMAAPADTVNGSLI